jgi:peptidoglycan/xylan/chitin deacetylase (PgdA/CDA1 family)
MTGLVLGIGAAGAAALGWCTFWPRSRFWGPVVARGSSGGPARYALTFDDGPTPQSTPKVLDVLAELRVRAAFFVIGANVRKCPDLLRRTYAEGHVIANHSWSHDHVGMFRGRRYWDRELRDTDDVIEQILGVRPAMFRPPMGIKTGYVMAAAARRGQTVVTWTRRAIDGIPTSPDRILNRLAPRTRAGDVLLLHDGVEPHSRRDPTPTLAAIRPLILRLRDRGLEAAALDEFLGVAPYAPETALTPGARPGT